MRPKQWASRVERAPSSEGSLEPVSPVLVYFTGNTMVVAGPESFTVLRRRSIACNPEADRVLGMFRMPPPPVVIGLSVFERSYPLFSAERQGATEESFAFREISD